MIKELNTENFQKETECGLKLIEFYTDWCGYCKKQLSELEFMDKIWIGQVNAEKNTQLSEKFNIKAYPTFLILKDGCEVERFSGFKSKEDIMSRLMAHL